MSEIVHNAVVKANHSVAKIAEIFNRSGICRNGSFNPSVKNIGEKFRRHCKRQHSTTVTENILVSAGNVIRMRLYRNVCVFKKIICKKFIQLVLVAKRHNSQICHVLSEYQTCIFICLDCFLNSKERKNFVKCVYIKFFKNSFY